MSRGRLLLTGAGGQLATDLEQRLAGDDLVTVGRAELDVTDLDAVTDVVGRVRPRLIVNGAAYTDVDGSESDEALALAVNGDGPGNLVAAASEVGARVMHVSTDYVFDGTLERPYHEWDVPNPRSAYGRTKLAGEQRLRPDDVVVRTSWLCGPHGSNILKTIVRLAEADTEMAFVDDQIGHPSFSGDVADVMVRLIDADAVGTFHVTNQGAVSWFGFVQSVLEALGRDVDQVRAIGTADLDPPRPAPRPANSVLDNLALRLWQIPPAPDYRDALPGVLAALSC